MAGIPARRRVGRVTLIVCGLMVAASAVLPGIGSRAAAAAVEPRVGYAATVAGWTSWYGSYGMGELGSTWCIDHGIPAPDPAYGYQPTAVADRAVVTRRAMAWALGQYGLVADRRGAAALTLVLHDLAGAQYPQGRLDVDSLRPDQLAGFGSDGADVLDRARAIKRDAVAHSRLVPPIRVEAGRDPGGPAVVVRITDSASQPVAGAVITLSGPDGGVGGRPTDGMTRSDATGRARLNAPPAGTALRVNVSLPDLTLDAFAPRVAVAQRVARPARSTLSVTLAAVLAPTTTVPPTTAPPTTAPPTTAPPTTAPPLRAAAFVTPPSPTLAPPVSPPIASSPAAPTLPFTGAATARLLRLGLGLVLLGVGACLTGRRVAS